MIAAKPMFLSKTSATTATARKASRVRVCSRVLPALSGLGVPVVGVAPVAERASERSGWMRPPEEATAAPDPAWTSSPSASILIDISLRPPRTTNRIAAITVFTARLEKKMVRCDAPRPASSITELVIVP